jgi:serine O-acetyltransferase
VNAFEALPLREMLSLVREDFRTNDRSLSYPGFQALAVHRFGNWIAGLPRVLRAIFRPLHTVGSVFVRNVYGIELPWTTRVGRRVRISHQCGIVIHPRTVIGDDCLIRQNVTIGAVSMQRIGGAPRLDVGVEVGAGAVIVGSITVGESARIGPNTVVMTSVPAGAMVVAPPPRVIQPRVPLGVPKAQTKDGREARAAS